MRILLVLLMLLMAHPSAAQVTDPPKNPSDSVSDSSDDEDDDEDDDDFEDEDGEGQEEESKNSTDQSEPTKPADDAKPESTSKDVGGSTPAETSGELKTAPEPSKEADPSPTKEKAAPKVDDPIGQCRRPDGAEKKKPKAGATLSPVDLELSRERRELEKAIRRYVVTAKDFRSEGRTMLIEAIEKRKKLLKEKKLKLIHLI